MLFEKVMDGKKENESLTVCDWGSSRLRAYRVDPAGEVLGRYQSDCGAKTLAGDAAAYAAELSNALTHLGGGPEQVITISGMAGSKMGWRETPYRATPVGRAEFISNSLTLEGFPHARLFGGVKHEGSDGIPDIMRGEEVQIFGAVHRHPGARVFCLPGTHSKWVRIEDEKIVSFTTRMTGDLFQGLCEKSIFAEQIASRDFHREGFLRGCRWAAESEGIHDLFRLRSAFVFARVSGEEFHSCLSGFLITHEIKSIRDLRGGKVHLCGAPELVSSYILALEGLGIPSLAIDAETATIQGHLALL